MLLTDGGRGAAPFPEASPQSIQHSCGQAAKLELGCNLPRQWGVHGVVSIVRGLSYILALDRIEWQSCLELALSADAAFKCVDHKPTSSHRGTLDRFIDAMSQPERRNLYRLLQVQPEAPVEVIKASYRALMTTLKAHPDLGGSHEHAAQLNDAYALLSDPQRRAEYDRTLKRRAPTSIAPTFQKPTPNTADPTQWRLTRRCPLCAQALGAILPKAPRCSSCDSPLTPAPSVECADAELLGRRRGDRFERAQDAVLYRPGAQPLPVRVKDLSLTGLALMSPEAFDTGACFRVVAAGFDAVAQVVARRAQGYSYSVHARLLTLQVLRSPAGTFVSAKA
jgi:DnaJ domain